MTALILDTSSEKAHVAFSAKGKLLCYHELPASRHLSKFLLPAIQSVLQGRKPDYLVLGKGPGSFIGLRVGGSIAQTLRFCWRIPLLTFPSTSNLNFPQIAYDSYQNFLKETFYTNQIELVYFSDKF